MEIRELREKRVKLNEDMKVFLDDAEQRDGGLSTEDKQIWEAMFDESTKMLGNIECRERQLELDRASAERHIEEEKEVAVAPKENGFRDYLATGDKRALQQDLDTQGGYTVPEGFLNELIKAVDNQTFFRSLSRVISVKGVQSLGIPSLENDPADPAWTAEIGSVGEDSTMSFGNRALTPHQLSKLLKVSDKLIQTSAMNIEALVSERLGYKFATTTENAYLNGDGAGKPLGVFTASANGISTGRDASTGNATTAVTFDGLKEAKYTLKSQYHANANWIMHRDVVKQISKLKDGEGQYIWAQSVTSGDPDTILGRPVRISEYAPNTMTTGQYVGIIGDFSNYWIADSLNFSIQRLNELYAENGQVGFVGRWWGDGMPVLEEAFVRVTLA